VLCKVLVVSDTGYDWMVGGGSKSYLDMWWEVVLNHS
jgi:hypothetical protein